MRTLHVDVKGTLQLVGSLPDVTQADCRVEAIEDCQRRGDVSDDRPGPEAIEVHLDRIRVGAACFQCIDSPHGKIADQQKGDHFTARLPAGVVRVGCAPA